MIRRGAAAPRGARGGRVVAGSVTAEPLRVGILGAARIAERAIVKPAHATGTRLVSVAARDRRRAEAFAAEHGVERATDSYAAVLADPEVEVWPTTRCRTRSTVPGTSPRSQRASTCSRRSTGRSAARHHVADLNVPIGCAGVAVYPGDVLIGDRDGVLVIPRHLVAEVAEQSLEQEKLEAFVSTKICEPLRGNYPPGEELKAEYKASLAAADEHSS